MLDCIGMETDWSALLKAVFGSAYLMSGTINQSDVVSTSGYRQRRDWSAQCRHHPYVGGRFRDDVFSKVAHFRDECAVSTVEGAWPCDVTVMSLPAASSAADDKTPCHSFVQTSNMTYWNALLDKSSERAVYASSSENKTSTLVELFFAISVFY